MTHNQAASRAFLSETKEFLLGVKSINFSEAEVVFHHGGTRVIVVESFQDDTQPIHILEWEHYKNNHIRVKSYQYSKSVPPRESKPRALRFIVPNENEKGVRRDLRDALERLGSNKTRREKLKIASIKIIEEKPHYMEWDITLW